MQTLQYYKQSFERFCAAGFDPSEARSLARIIISHVLGCEPGELLFHRQEELDDHRCDLLTERVLQGEPLQYALGSSPFMGLDFLVGPGVLIPRFDSESLVERAIQLLSEPWQEAAGAVAGDATATDKLAGSLLSGDATATDKLAESLPSGDVTATDKLAGSLPSGDATATDKLATSVSATSVPSGDATTLRIADVCCGSGCLGLSLAHYLPRSQVFFTDISPRALAMTQRNSLRLGLSRRCRFAQGDLAQPLLESGWRPQLLIANPPYIPSSELAQLSPLVQREPRLALDGGADGLALYPRLIAQARQLLPPGGLLLLEHGDEQQEQLWQLLEQGGLEPLERLRDLGGRPRGLLARQNAD